MPEASLNALSPDCFCDFRYVANVATTASTKDVEPGHPCLECSVLLCQLDRLPVGATLASHKNAVANVSQTKIQYGGRTTG